MTHEHAHEITRGAVKITYNLINFNINVFDFTSLLFAP
jgi:hypothetical protein